MYHNPDANRDKSIDESLAKWFVNHVMPRNGAKETEPVRPMIINCLALDTGRPNSDGSISEYCGWNHLLISITGKP